MATNRNKPWGECEILSSRTLSEEEVWELKYKDREPYSLEDDIRSSIESMNKAGYNIVIKDNMVISDFDTIVELVRVFSYNI